MRASEDPPTVRGVCARRAIASTLAVVVALAAGPGCYRSSRRSEAHDAGPARDAPGPVLVDAPPPRPDVPLRDAGPPPFALTRCEGAGGLGATGYDVRCGSLPMPLDRDDPASRSIDIYMEAVEPFGAVRAQLWMLQGGPGGSTTYDFEVYGAVLGQEVPGLEVLLLDHRGTGRSSRIVCDGESIGSDLGTAFTDAEWSACVDELAARRDEAVHLSTTEAARDLSDAIEALRRPGIPVFVYGVSYGTYWAHRWLQLFPTQANGVVLDSTCSPGECSFPVAFGRNFDRVGRELLRRCAADAACRAHVGADPVARLEAALADFDAGACPHAVAAGLTGVELRQMAGAFIADPVFRGALPALALRASRCAPGDEPAFATLDSAFAPIPGDEASFEGLSLPLYAIVARSELWDLPATEAAEDAIVRSLIAYVPLQPDVFAAWARVPRYDPGPLATMTAVTAMPTLFLQGELDPQTSVEDAAPLRAALSGPAQTYVELPRATHGILARHGATAADDCGIRMLRDFIAAPRAPIDSSCRDQEPPLNFVDDSLASAVFGTSSLYEPTLAPRTHALTLRDLELRERLRRALHRPPALRMGR